MKILSDLKNIKLNLIDNSIELIINESNNIKYNLTKSSNNEILADLIDHKAYATTFLFLNENYQLDINKNSFINESNVIDFYKDCEELLNENVKVVTEKGPLLVSIKGYPIYEVENGILRGSGENKIFESFDLDLFPAIKDQVLKYKEEGKDKSFITDYINGQVKQFSISKDEATELKELLNEEGTQVSDIAPKVDQSLGINKPKIVSTKINGLKENLVLRGFLRNELGQYERGNYILCLENNKYIAINKDKLKESL